jgi:hypothetical protein
MDFLGGRRIIIWFVLEADPRLESKPNKRHQKDRLMKYGTDGYDMAPQQTLTGSGGVGAIVVVFPS